MTEGEKMVWAATYAAGYIEARNNQRMLGIPLSISELIEDAWASVVEMRGNREKVRDGFGDKSGVLNMLDEMLRDPDAEKPQPEKG